MASIAIARGKMQGYELLIAMAMRMYIAKAICMYTLTKTMNVVIDHAQ